MSRLFCSFLIGIFLGCTSAKSVLAGFNFDFTRVEDTRSTPQAPIANGDYLVEIASTKTVIDTVGIRYVLVSFRVIGGLYADRMIEQGISFNSLPDAVTRRSSVLFAKYFLKVIGEPYTGVVVVEPNNWLRKRLKATISSESYAVGRETRQKNVIIKIWPI